MTASRPAPAEQNNLVRLLPGENASQPNSSGSNAPYVLDKGPLGGTSDQQTVTCVSAGHGNVSSG